MSKLTVKKQQAFLAAIAMGKGVTATASMLGLTKQAFYGLRDRDPAFAAAWADAVDSGVDALEEEAYRRAREGSDTMLIFLLKSWRPERYRETYRVQGNVKHEHEHELGPSSRALLEMILGSIGGEE